MNGYSCGGHHKWAACRTVLMFLREDALAPGFAIYSDRCRD